MAELQADILDEVSTVENNEEGLKQGEEEETKQVAVHTTAVATVRKRERRARPVTVMLKP